ncbi:hypothetical protein NQ318_022377 [Aromia moschata]|uniref:Vacuolar ATPase assembly protein VMA22 n=1 Tax=Aromia moschata TaxID=1265417 RepID=A0AAV8Z5U8_9CUCU|nr:hypothetical protein NQ318_022377 [Aromia moschata]
MVEATEDLDRICNTLDKLTLDALSLMEEEIQLKLIMENSMCGGEGHLAKARYIMGQSNVSFLQLPTENSTEFSAVTKVFTNEEDKLYGEKSFELRVVKKDEDETVHDPLKWFGYLVPQNLNYAQNMFRQALQWAIEALNIQTQLRETVRKIEQLKQVKANIVLK